MDRSLDAISRIYRIRSEGEAAHEGFQGVQPRFVDARKLSEGHEYYRIYSTYWGLRVITGQYRRPPTVHVSVFHFCIDSPCVCLMPLSDFEYRSSVNGKTMCVNIYDIRLSDTYPACGMNWPPDLKYITPYLRRDDVRVALHVPGSSQAWTECRGIVGNSLVAKKSKPSVGLLPKILDRGVEVLLFSGDQDLICNYVGTERMIENLEWSGATGFNVSYRAHTMR